MKFLPPIAAAVAALALAPQAFADTLHLDSYTAALSVVDVTASPTSTGTGSVYATGFNITNQTSGETAVYWCLDIDHYLMNGASNPQDYTQTSDPWSNSYGLTDTAEARVQALYDANWGTLDLSDPDVAAAFQMALWEAAFEDDANGLDLTSGDFVADSGGSDALAAQYLAAADAYILSGDDKLWNMSFWEVDGDSNRARNSGQNLVTVARVPVPAAILFLLLGLGAMGAVGRRRSTAA